MSLFKEMAQILSEGLQRKSSTTCARWAENYIVLGKPVPGPMRFEKFPWSFDMCNENGDWVGKKAAQMGYTQVSLARAIYTVDILRNDVLYILPKRNPDASDFSKSKFDTLLDLSPHIKKLFSNVQNIGHKQAGHTNLYIRGARSRSALKSISVGLRIYDEYDEMPMKNVSLADERSSGYATEDKQKICLSTPTAPDFGIDLEFQRSTQEHFVFRCPSCSRYTELVFPDCIVVTADSMNDERNLRRSHLRCKECGGILRHENKPEWLKHHLLGGTAKWENIYQRDSYVRGFHVNQLYSMTVAPWEIAKLILKAQYDPSDEQELYNSKMGLAHLVKGARITDGMLDLLISDHQNGDPSPLGAFVTMGVDVGKWIHYHIDQWLLPSPLGADLSIGSISILREEGKVSSFEELDRLMLKHQVVHCVIDAMPETRKAYEFALRHQGHVHLCRFYRGIMGKRIGVNENEMLVAVDRTSWLDLSQSRFKGEGGHRKILLPRNTSDEFKEHVKALCRIEGKDADGNPTAKYISLGPDHAAFARLYSEIALHMAVSIAENQDVNTFI